MTNEPTKPTDPEVPDEAAGDVPVEPDIRVEVPERLDLPIEVPEADALDQEIEVPLDDDDVR